MRAKLKDGAIVELVKDCECIIHDGPHWLYSDGMTRAMLDRDFRELIERIIAKGAAATENEVRHCEVLFENYAERQIVRLNELQRNMAQRGIVEFIRDWR